MRSIVVVTGFFLLACGNTPEGYIYPDNLTCEYVVNPNVVDRAEPRLAWINATNDDFRGQKQTAYQIRVASEEQRLSSPDLWDSEKVVSERSFGINYQGIPLGSGQDCWWQVRIWDKDGKPSPWSKAGHWKMGILDPSLWNAKWIGAPWQGEQALPEPSWPGAPVEKWPPPAPLFRKEVQIQGKIKKATAFVTGLGYFEFYVNGKKQGEDVLVPNQTNYGKRDYLLQTNIPLPDDFEEYKIMYLAYDITDHLQEGANAFGAILGNGFYDAAKYWSGSYGSPRFMGQVHLEYEDGSEEVIVSDESWKTAQGPILRDMVFYGEIYDARLEIPGWSQPNFDESGWEPVAIRETPHGKLVAHTPYTDRITERLKPAAIKQTDSATYIVDFGVEISGWVRLNQINGPAGHKIEIKFISNTPSGDNVYYLNGSGNESYAPRFNWFVFSAVELINWPGELTKEHIIAEAVNTHIEQTAVFETSNELFNDINKIWVRSQLDNMHGGIVSDCPHRERSPYTGDGQVACATVMHNFDARSFYDKWIADIRGSQIRSTGYVPNCSPWQPGCGGGVAWGAAMCIIPWEFYLQYGSREILEENFHAMKGYVNYMTKWVDKEGVMHSQRTGKDGKVLKWFNLGEWGCYEDQCPSDEMVHTYFLWKCTDIMAKSAEVLGLAEEVSYYTQLIDKTKNAFHNRFYDSANATYGGYGANVFALDMGITDNNRQKVVHALKRNIEENQGHLHTGIFGTRLLFEILTENQLHQLAYEAMNKKTEPGFGYWLADGATTTREFWDNGGSHNHPMFGGGLTWFYRKLAGMEVDPQHPGYNHIIFKPHLVDELNYVKYYNRTQYGWAGIHWVQDPGSLSMDITIPVGSTATVFIPTTEPDKIKESGESLGRIPEVDLVGQQDGYSVIKINSGVYSFMVEGDS